MANLKTQPPSAGPRASGASACPFCLKPLHENSGRWECPACSEVGQKQPDGFHSFGQGHQENPSDDSSLHKLATRIQKFSLPEDIWSLYASLDLKEIGELSSLVNPFYNGWPKFFLNISGSQRVLVIESGLGGDSLSLAPHVSELDSFHADPTRARCTAKRVALAGLRNVTVTSARTINHLPFPDGTFDLAVVRQWEKAPRMFKEPGLEGNQTDRLLSELRRLLGPQGLLYIDGQSESLLDSLGGGNRGRFSPVSMGWKLLRLGLPHQEYLLCQKDREKYPYSVRRFLKNQPAYVKLKQAAASLVRPQHVSIIGRGRSTKKENTLLEDILKQLPGSDGRIESGAGRIGLGSANVYMAQTERHIVRIPTTEKGLSRCRNNSETLRQLKELSLSFETPKFVAEGSHQGCAYFVETKISGRAAPYLQWSRSRMSPVINQARTILADLDSKTRQRAMMSDERFGQLFSKPLGAAAEYFDKGTLRGLREFQSMVEGMVLGKEIDLVRTHGDFKMTNLLLEGKNSVTGIVDWDLSLDKGLPFMDAVLWLGFEQMIYEGIPYWRAIYEAGFGSKDHPINPDWNFQSSPEDGLRWKCAGLLTLLDYFLNHLSDECRWNHVIRAQFSEYITSACRQILSSPEVRQFSLVKKVQ